MSRISHSLLQDLYMYFYSFTVVFIKLVHLYSVTGEKAQIGSQITVQTDILVVFEE